MKVYGMSNPSADSLNVLEKQDLLIYFHCTARAVVDEGEYFIEIVKSNTDEMICREKTDENGFFYDAKSVREKCKSIANNPYGNLIITVITHEKKRLKEEAEKKYKEDREKFYYEKENLEEVIQRRAQDMFERYKKEWEEKNKKESNDTK